ncbi:glutamine synthetase, partial [Thioclava sp. BHET1]
ATDTAQTLPRTLSEAAERMSGSAMLRRAFGDDVVDHYTRAARWEVEEQGRVVTDWELRRGLERA